MLAGERPPQLLVGAFLGHGHAFSTGQFERGRPRTVKYWSDAVLPALSSFPFFCFLKNTAPQAYEYFCVQNEESRETDEVTSVPRKSVNTREDVEEFNKRRTRYTPVHGYLHVLCIFTVEAMSFQLSLSYPFPGRLPTDDMHCSCSVYVFYFYLVLLAIIEDEL